LSEESTEIKLSAVVAEKQDNIRLDQAAAELFPEYSRARLQSWIGDGMLLLNGKQAKRKEKVSLGDSLELTAELKTEQAWVADEIDLCVVYEDDQLIVVNKPQGLITHPGAGNPRGTLANGLLHHYPELSQIPRAGIVHRLDKDTSGLMVVARSLMAHNSLVHQLQERSVSRHYLALVHGRPPPEGTINKALGRHPQQRQKMAIREDSGKPAITHFETLKLYEGCALVECKLETGRTHQIRVHMTDLGFPLVGDTQYGTRRRVSRSIAKGIQQALSEFPRQALHAKKLVLKHPADGSEASWEAPIPDDFKQLLEIVSKRIVS